MSGLSDQILTIDIGAGTQDILLYDPSRTPENCFRLVMPSRTQIVGAEIRAVTAAGHSLHLTGEVMGGGASTSAITDHLAAGLPVTATASAARTVHNNPDRVRASGVQLAETAPDEAVVIRTGDLDLNVIEATLNAFGLPMPTRFAIAVQDHGVRIGQGNNDVRGDYLHWLVNDAKDLGKAAFTSPPSEMTRMHAVQNQATGAIVMDTGAAAVLGALRDQRVAEAADEGAVLVNIGNMHTFAVLIRGRSVLGVFEHHTGGITREIIATLVDRMRHADLSNAEFRAHFDGHGAVLSSDYDGRNPFTFVAVTGPNRGLVDDLGWYQASPHGDMMLTGSFGLVDGYLAATGGNK